MNVLFSMKNMDVISYAIGEPPKSFWPISHTSRISGCFRQKRHKMSEVYSTVNATANVTSNPGTKPRTEYDLHETLRSTESTSGKLHAPRER